jgi:hypothetical protein
MNPLWNLTRTLLGQEEQQNVIIRVDPAWGFSEFPAPGDTKKHLLPILIDPEDVAVVDDNAVEKIDSRPAKEFWMPDKYCKVCYGCEEPFTMFRRRHHCRMCGQIFCNTCSSYSLDGAMFNAQGVVRACRLCYEQALERSELELKQHPRKFLERSAQDVQHSHHVMREISKEFNSNIGNLQSRASAHLAAIVKRLVYASTILSSSDRDMWIDIILTLVRGVVESVDPDVRAGDELDIRPYVKIKVIPGGETSECCYVDGVVFRKNVSHKRMGTYGVKDNPRVLLLAGGIEFQRADTKLSSMDTLIEQEDKYMELLVEKIMSLKPDIILVGKSVARKAQELLCEHRLIVMQNVKLKLLERLSRMTGAMLLPSTDTMIQQYGEECLGTCGNFRLRLVQDDPEKSTSALPQRILRTRISRASTYAYIQGCPPERGGTIVLRGAFRNTLKEIKRILRFSVLVAYHLRLEVAYYSDRFADLPALIDDADYEDSSDLDDEPVDEKSDILALAEGNQKLISYFEKNPAIRSRRERYYLCMSMDVDVLTPRRRELLGAPPIRYKPITAFNIETHQTLLITSVLMGEGPSATPVQKNPADVKAIQFYTNRDVAVGKFIIEHCFQLHRGIARECKMLDQTLSFIHRFGRIDISIRRDRLTPVVTEETAHRDPLRIPINISSYCKECQKVVTPHHALSDEVWKMSFGKFLELMFYNRSARCTVGGCRHNLRDCHILSFLAEGYMAVFEFVPIHPYTLIVRNFMSFPEEFYAKHTSLTLSGLPALHMTLMDDFRTAISVLDREIKEILFSRPEDMQLAMADVRMIEAEIDIFTVMFLDQLVKTMEAFITRYPGFSEVEVNVLLMLQDRLAKNRASISQSSQLMDAYADMNATDEDGSTAKNNAIEDVPRQASEIFAESLEGGQSVADFSIPRTNFVSRTAVIFPYVHYRDAFLRASRWNTRIDTIYKFLESVRTLILQQQQAMAAAIHLAGGTAANTMEEIMDMDRKPLAPDAPIVHPPLAPAVVVHEHNYSADNVVSPDGSLSLAVVTATTSTEKSSIVATVTAVDSSIAEPVVEKESMVIPSAHPAISTSSNVAPPLFNDTSLGITSLYRAVQEQNRKTAEKPNDKMSKITKALSRFLAGNKDNADEQQKFVVPLGDFGHGRFGLAPGRDGIVVPVHDDSHASIIAYALASQEYWDNLQASIRDDHYDQGDYDNGEDFAVLSSKKPSTSASASASTSAAPNTPPIRRGLGTIHEENNDDHDEELTEKSPIDNNNLGNTNNFPGAAGNGKNDPTAVAKTNTYALSELLANQAEGERGNDDVSGFNMGNEGLLEESELSPAAKSGDSSGGNISENLIAAVSSANPVVSNPTNIASSGATPINSPPEDPSTPLSPGSSGRKTVSATAASSAKASTATTGFQDANDKQMMSQDKSDIRIRFNDYDDRGQLLCKFSCQVYWAKQFEALRKCFFKDESGTDSLDNFIRSLAMSARWSAQGGKSGASFSKTMDERMVIKVISRVELQMFLDFAPAYFEYMSKAYYQFLPTVLCKILGVYTVRYDNKETGKRMSENIVVMENIFYQRNITKTFDLKGSSRARYVELQDSKQRGVNFDEVTINRRQYRRKLRRVQRKLFRRKQVKSKSDTTPDDASGIKDDEYEDISDGEDEDPENMTPPSEPVKIGQVLMDDNLMEFTRGRPFPMKPKAKYFFKLAVDNDTLFLSIVNVVDYSILVGFDDERQELVVGIIDYLRQVCFMKFHALFILRLFFIVLNTTNCVHSMILSRRWSVWAKEALVC